MASQTDFALSSFCQTKSVCCLAERYFLSAADIDYWRYLKGAKQETRHRRNGSTYFFSEGSMAFPDCSNLPARTMPTSEGSVSRSTHVVADPQTQRLRTLTPIECERLNGFPDDWTAGMPERLRYFTMGNALVVPLVKAMGKRISALAEDEQRS